MSLKSIVFIWLLMMAFVKPAVALAGPHFTLTPGSGSYSNGSSFSVTLGADSGTESIIAIDVAGTFDAKKLDLVSIEKVSSPAFAYDSDSLTPVIDSTNGKFEISLNPKSASVYAGSVVNGPLLILNFKAKSAGVAAVNLTCTNGSTTDSNIVNISANDVAECSSNQSGSYTIGGSTTTESTTSSELPRTGGIASTVGLVVFGIVSGAAALLLRFL